MSSEASLAPARHQLLVQAGGHPDWRKIGRKSQSRKGTICHLSGFRVSPSRVLIGNARLGLKRSAHYAKDT